MKRLTLYLCKISHIQMTHFDSISDCVDQTHQSMQKQSFSYYFLAPLLFKLAKASENAPPFCNLQIRRVGLDNVAVLQK